MQKVRGYLRLARIVAELTGENADDCALRVMQGTDLWRSPGNREEGDSRDERAARLQWLIRKMARFVIREAKLEDSFATLAKIPDPDGNPFSHRFENDEINLLDEIEPAKFLPGVQLARLPMCELPVTAYPVGEVKSGVGGGAFQATLRLSHDIRLVIGPTTAPVNIGPMFESLPYIEMIPGNGVDEDSRTKPPYILSSHWNLEFDAWDVTFFHQPDATKPDTDKGMLWTEAVFYRDTGEGEVESEFYLKTGEPVRPIGDACDPRGERFTNLYCRQWRRMSNALEFSPRDCWRWWLIFWRPADADHVSALLDREAPLSPSMTVLSARVSCFPRGTVAFDFESRIEAGELERALILDSERIKQYVQDRSDDLDERDARLAARWADDAEEHG